MTISFTNRSAALRMTGGAVLLAAGFALAACGKKIEEEKSSAAKPPVAGATPRAASAPPAQKTPAGPPHQYVSPSSGDAKVDLVREDMRHMANALEAYYADHKAYPPSTLNPVESINAAMAAANPGDKWDIPSFTQPTAGGPFALITTPVAYMAAIPNDPYAKTVGRTYSYFQKSVLHSDGKRTLDGWILWSPGPDGDYDFDWNLYDPLNILANVDKPEWNNALYDPTNGAGSSGDLMRIR